MDWRLCDLQPAIFSLPLSHSLTHSLIMASTPGASAAPPAGADGNASAAGGGASSFIGALISLLSRSDIRYQGFLNSIDSAQATIALEKGETRKRQRRRCISLIDFAIQVRSWGTEGRLAKAGKPNEELPPNENVYDFIVFRAADVKDLKIDDPHPDRSRPPPPPQQALQDPAILGVSGTSLLHLMYGKVAFLIPSSPFADSRAALLCNMAYHTDARLRLDRCTACHHHHQVLLADQVDPMDTVRQCIPVQAAVRVDLPYQTMQCSNRLLRNLGPHHRQRPHHP